jgi:hypothetical protein
LNLILSSALLWHQLTGKSVLAVSSDVFSAIFMHLRPLFKRQSKFANLTYKFSKLQLI